MDASIIVMVAVVEIAASGTGGGPQAGAERRVAGRRTDHGTAGSASRGAGKRSLLSVVETGATRRQDTEREHGRKRELFSHVSLPFA